MGNVGNYYCFYNPQDNALATGTVLFGRVATSWEADQVSYKPDGNPGLSGLGYYNMSPGTPNYNPVNEEVTLPNRAVDEAHESMSFVARPRSQAAGADINSPVVFGNAFNLQALYGFGSALSDHSGQFTRDYNQVYSLYHKFETIIAPSP